MPRTRRADAPGSDGQPEPTPQTGTEKSAPKSRNRRRRPPADSQPKAVAEPSQPAAAESRSDSLPDTQQGSPVRPPRTRGPRKTVSTAELSSSVSPESAPGSGEQPAVGDPAAAPSDSMPSRRRRPPRTKKADPVDALMERVEAVLDTDEPEEETQEGQEARRRGRTRRRRGSSSPVPIVQSESDAAAQSQAPAETTGTEEDEIPNPVRRGRSRRRRGTAVSAGTEESESDATAAVEETADGSETPAEEEPKRGRRPRRSNRRRSLTADELLEASESILLVDGELEAAPDEEEDLDAVLPLAPVEIPTYIAPPLVPLVDPELPRRHGPRVTASVIVPPHAGLARIQINEQSHLPYFFFVNADTAEDGAVVDAQIRQAAAAGIHLFSGVMYLPLKNAYGDRSFGPIDALVHHILANDPNGYIIPRLQFVPTNYWLRTHSDQIATHADGSQGDVSLASKIFWEDCVEALEALVAHLNNPDTEGGDRVIGFHIDRGEWFYDVSAGYDLSEPNTTGFQNWLQERYQQVYALRAAWYDGSVTFESASVPAWTGQPVNSKVAETPLYLSARDRRWSDYAQYSSELIAQAITGLASAAKTMSERRLLVAVSYGYTMEFAARNDSGHLAMAKLLASDDIDILAGPNAYSGRGAGNPASFGAAIDSVRLHNKLWVVEDDTKTFLAETETDDTYNPKIVSGADTQAAHQRHFGAALAHQAGVSWMDLWGHGWLNSDEIWQELGGLARLADRWDNAAAARTAPRTLTPDVVVFVDEASLCLLRSDTAGLGSHLIVKTRDLLLRAGANVGFYLQSDLTHPDLPEAALYLFLNALRLTSSERLAIREKLHQPGKTLCWLYAPGVFDENGPAVQEAGEVIGMTLRAQAWNVRLGSSITEHRHPVTERLRNTRRIGQDEILSPSYSVNDPQAAVLAEYTSNGAPSLAVREHSAGWKSVFIGDPYLTIELLRGIYSYAGVPVYEAQDDVLYASSDGVLLLHAAYAGQRTVNLPTEGTVYDAMDHKIIAVDSRQFRTFLRPRTTRLFLIGSTDEIVAATGLPLPPPSVRIEAEALEPLPNRGSTLVQEGELSLESDEEIAASEELDERIAGVRLFLAELAEGVPPLENEEGGAGFDDPSAASDEERPAPRSRWQRRRAAARARRDSERQARGVEGSSAQNPDGTTVIDMTALLPDLPPRRIPAESQPPETDSEEA